MELDSSEVVNVLKRKGIYNIFHANSVLTSCHFLKKGSIVSRGSIERLNLAQTEQYTDDIDQMYGIWFDLFFDSSDIHHRAKRPNKYGPVTFVFNIDILLSSSITWITKRNPAHWDELDQIDKWFQSLEEVEEDFLSGEFCQHIVMRNTGGETPFKDHLIEVILDDPMKRTTQKTSYYSMAYGALMNSACYGKQNITISRRNCPDNCTCIRKYKNNWADYRKLFAPYNL